MIEIQKGLLLDKVETEVRTDDFEGSSKKLKKIDSVMYELRQKREKITLKTNVGKALNNGFNTGAEPEIVKEYIDLTEEKGILKLGKHSSIEYCINIEIDFNTKKENRFWNDVFNMLIDNKFKTSTLSLDNQEKVNRNGSMTKDRIVGIKGYKTGRTFKLYSKLFEKGICSENPDKDVIRLELELNSKGLSRLSIEELEDLVKVKAEILGYLDSIKKESGKRKNRWNRNTHFIVEQFKKNVNY